MSNQLQLPQRIKSSTLIDFTSATYSVTSGIIARAVGDTVAITATSTGAGATVTITAANHGLIAGEHVTIAGTTSYNDTYEVTSITDIDNFVITETNSESSESGTFVDAYQESPVGGIVQRLFYPAGSSSPSVRINLDTPQNVYPNCGMICKTNLVNTYSWLFRFQPQTDNNTHNWTFDGLKQQKIGYEVNEWAHYSFINGDKVENGTVLPWATDEDDQAFLTSSINLFANTGSINAPGQVFYIAGVYTDNFPKAKLILTFDDFPATVNTVALPLIEAKGWKAGVAAIGSLMDATDASRAKVQQVYDAGWDVINHTWSHNQADATMSDGTWIEDALRCYNWQLEHGWVRGSNFIAYPLIRLELFGNDGGDVADRFFAFGRGSTDRSRYGFQSRSAERASDTLNNQIPDDAINIQAVQDAYSTLYATGAAGSVKARLAEVNQSHGVMVVYMHGLVASGGTASDNTIDWFEAFLADIQGYVDADTLEVVRLSDWYEELSGMSADSVNDLNGFFVQGE